VTFARLPNGGDRTALMRPQNVTLALKRFSEWNALVDSEGPASEAADALWVVMLQEQQWAFIGWMDMTTKRVLDHEGKDIGEVKGGDLHIFESQMKGWGRGDGA
jgi:hypothetical protein